MVLFQIAGDLEDYELALWAALNHLLWLLFTPASNSVLGPTQVKVRTNLRRGFRRIFTIAVVLAGGVWWLLA